MAEVDETLEIASRPTAEIKDEKRRRAFDAPEQRLDVLTDIVVTGSLPKPFGSPVIVAQGEIGDVL